MRKRFTTVERLEEVARAAIIGGYGQAQTWQDTGGPRRRVYCDLSMDCEWPYEAELHARYSATAYKRVKPLTVVIRARCRKCRPCKERRATMWRGKAFTEFQKSERTFFGTLTTSPEFDMRLDAEIQVALTKRGVDFGRLNPKEQFVERVKYGGKEVTDYLKRLRGDAKSARRLSFRYLLIAEAHDSVKTAGAKVNRPHWHILVHETKEGGAIVLPHEFAYAKNGSMRTDKFGNPYLADDAFLKSRWTVGFSTFLQAGSPQAATYVCKYLTKEANHRIRCSFRYGADEVVAGADGTLSGQPSTTPQGGI